MEFDDDFNLENPFSNSNDDDDASFPLLLFHTETAHMPSSTYLQTLSTTRRCRCRRGRIVSLIQYYSLNFDPFSPYLAINYMDRFLSTSHYSIPLDGKPWILNLVAVSCVSLALKMRKMEFSISDFQDDLFNCYNRMQQAVVAAMDDCESVVEMGSCTPANVLDAQCFSYSSSENKQMSATGNGDIRGLKRRKTSEFAADM
ncbi:UNVERIFIED_CONTAM: putative cyclin-D6-1 [Sesamum calycinum]|uniref:Cyclin-D6-1 n=1 Tax=Sesamum calycinum TaxID=2727403 RepID=A0AAW2ITC3_9LAMI